MGNILEFKPRAGEKVEVKWPPAAAVTGQTVVDDGAPIIVRCRDIAGECCHKCHDYADDGVEALLALLDERLRITHSVCCRKHNEAMRRRDFALAQKRAGKPPNPRILTPTNECIR